MPRSVLILLLALSPFALQGRVLSYAPLTSANATPTRGNVGAWATMIDNGTHDPAWLGAQLQAKE